MAALAQQFGAAIESAPHTLLPVKFSRFDFINHMN